MARRTPAGVAVSATTGVGAGIEGVPAASVVDAEGFVALSGVETCWRLGVLAVEAPGFGPGMVWVADWGVATRLSWLAVEQPARIISPMNRKIEAFTGDLDAQAWTQAMR